MDCSKNIKRLFRIPELWKLLNIMECWMYQELIFGDNKLAITLKKMLMILNWFWEIV
jgi:hypothetical protein